MSSADVAILAAQDLVEALQKRMLNAPSTTINDTDHILLRILTELFNIIPKSLEQKPTNRHNGKRRERQYVSVEPYQVSAPVTHRYPSRK